MSDKTSQNEHFLGRKDALLALGTVGSKHAAITIIGPPGVGKSTFISHFLRLEPHVWINVRSSSIDDITDTIAGLIGFPVTLENPTPSSIKNVVFDAAEHAVEAVRAWTEWWVRSGARVFITSRQLIEYEGEVEFELGPLPPDVSRSLFVQISNVEDTSPDVDDLIASLDGLPLAIELAASRTSVMTPGQMTNRLDRRFDWLRDLRLQKPSLESVIQASWAALNEREREVLISLTAFAAEFTLDAAEAVSTIAEGEQATVNILDALVNRSLVQRRAQKFRLLDSIRSFAERESPSVAANARERHAAYFTMADLGVRDMVNQMPIAPTECTKDLIVIRKRFSDPTSSTHQRATLLWSLGMRFGKASRARVISELDSVMRLTVDEDLKGAFGFVRGGFYRDAGRLGEALHDLNCVVLGLTDWPELLARAHGELINIHGTRRDLESAQRSATQALDLFQRAGNHEGVTRVHLALGATAFRAGDLKLCESENNKALSYAQAHDLPVIAIRVNLAGVKLAAGAVEDVIELADRCILDDQIDDRSLCICLINRGTAHLVLGDLERAEADFMRTLDVNSTIGRQLSEQGASNSLALVWLERGDQQKARFWATRARGDHLDDAQLGTEILAVSALTALPDATKANDFLRRAGTMAIADNDKHIVELVASILSGKPGLEIPVELQRMPLFSTLMKLTEHRTSDISLSPDGQILTVNGTSHDLARRGAMRRVLARVAQAHLDGTTVDVYQLFEAGWPGEVAGPEQAASRVYATLSRLRQLGLSEVIVTLDNGYTLSKALCSATETKSGDRSNPGR